MLTDVWYWIMDFLNKCIQFHLKKAVLEELFIVVVEVLGFCTGFHLHFLIVSTCKQH